LLESKVSSLEIQLQNLTNPKNSDIIITEEQTSEVTNDES
jgi:hypothetical protein